MKIKVDFNVTSDLFNLAISDYSNWLTIEDKPSIIEVTIPGFRKPITKYFQKGVINLFNSFTLDLNCYDECIQPDVVALPDGIYKVKVIGSPETFNREDYYLKTDAFDLEVSKVLIKNLDRIEEESFVNKMSEIQLLMRGAEAFTEYKSFKEANMLFEQASSMIDKFNCC